MLRVKLSEKDNEDRREVFGKNSKPVKSKYTRVPKQSSTSFKNTKPKRKGKKFIFLLVPILLILGFASVYASFLAPTGKAFDINPFPTFVDGLTGKVPTLNSTNGRTNVLILGVDNRAEDLTQDLSKIENTDTILIASYDQNGNEAQMISIPRDLGMKFKFPTGYTYYNRINSAVAYGINEEYPGGGLQLLKDSVKDLTGLKIDYTVILNFQAFTEVIDTLGGVDINVENSFCDAEYPNGTYGTEVIKFFRGPQHMDGATALKFARSRVHAECSSMSTGDPEYEGSDFRRAHRQQQVIKAVQDKISTLGLDIGKIQGILSSVGNNLLTEIGDGPLNDSNKFDLQTLRAFYELKFKLKDKSITSFVLAPDSCGGDKFTETSIEGQYIILPTNGTDFSGVRDCLSYYLSNPQVFADGARVGVYNNGRGYDSTSELATQMEKDGFIATFYENISVTSLRNLAPETVAPDVQKGNYIVDLSKNKSKTMDALSKKYNAQILEVENLPVSIQKLNGVDIIFLAGE